MPLSYYAVKGDKGDPGTLSLKYGAFQDTSTQLNPTPGAANIMTFNTIDFPDGVLLTNANDGLLFPTPGLYNMQWSGQFAKVGNNNADVYVWLKQNGTNIVGSAGQITIQNRGIVGWNYFCKTTVPNETLQIAWSSVDATMHLTAYPANGIHPSTASVIITVTQVA